jgi:RNA polymerase sigma-70 factor (ECF subfamily)
MNDLTPRDRSMLRFHLIDGLSIDQIGKLESVHRATAARWIAAARKKIHDAVRADLRRQMKLTRAELESLIRVVRSRLDFSVKRHLV